MKRLSLMVTEPLFEQVELARGDVPRERWLRRAVERALGDAKPRTVSPAPAEQLERSYEEARGALPRGDAPRAEERVREARDLAYPKPSRPFRPYPKGGK